ncbi:hypothetical protein Pgy4_15469, partial [Pseudomonas savastanoi pv. glycinea str. race 4]
IGVTQGYPLQLCILERLLFGRRLQPRHLRLVLLVEISIERRQLIGSTLIHTGLIGIAILSLCRAADTQRDESGQKCY